MVKHVLTGVLAVALLSLSSFSHANISTRLKSARVKAVTAQKLDQMAEVYSQCKENRNYKNQDKKAQKQIRDFCTEQAIQAIKTADKKGS